MPHLFKVECYRTAIIRRRASPGDTVYLKSRPDVPMTVTAIPFWNSAADPNGDRLMAVEVSYFGPDMHPIAAKFLPHELSL
jgi:hypothetical protein